MKALSRVYSRSTGYAELLHLSDNLDYVWGAVRDLDVLPKGEVCPTNKQKFYSYWGEDGYVEIIQGRNILEILLRNLLTPRKPL